MDPIEKGLGVAALLVFVLLLEVARRILWDYRKRRKNGNGDDRS